MTEPVPVGRYRGYTCHQEEGLEERGPAQPESGIGAVDRRLYQYPVGPGRCRDVAVRLDAAGRFSAGATGIVRHLFLGGADFDGGGFSPGRGNYPVNLQVFVDPLALEVLHRYCTEVVFGQHIVDTNNIRVTNFARVLYLS